jgi:hypothetical protein
MTPQQKRESAKARVTCDLKGSVKAKFFDEIIKTGIKESDLARTIFASYYEEKKERF